MSFSTRSASLMVLAIYVICTLIGMAPMNLAFGLVFLVFAVHAIQQRSLLLNPVLIETDAVPDAELSHFLRQYRIWGGILFAACTLSLVLAWLAPCNYVGHDPEVTIHGITKIWYLLIPFILFQVFSGSGGTEANFKILNRTWGVTTLLMGVVALIQFNTGWPNPQVIPTNPTHFHAILFLGHHLSTASIFIFPAFTAFAIAIGGIVRDKRLFRLETAVAAVGILILFLSYARAAWLSLPVGIVLVCARYLNRKQLVLFLIGFVISVGVLTQTPAMKERIIKGYGVSERLELWKANIDFFKCRPITGIGWLKTQEMSEFYFKKIDPDHYKERFWGHAHSNIFEMLGGTGLIGLLAFLAWSLFTFRFAISTAQKATRLGQYYWSDFSWGIFVALLLLHFNGLTNVTFWEGKVMHQQMLAVGMLFMVQKFLKRIK